MQNCLNIPIVHYRLDKILKILPILHMYNLIHIYIYIYKIKYNNPICTTHISKDQ